MLDLDASAGLGVVAKEVIRRDAANRSPANPSSSAHQHERIAMNQRTYALILDAHGASRMC